MKCPYCDEEMEYKDKGYWGYPFSTGIEPDYPDWICNDIYTCKKCNIKNTNGEWKIPKKYNRPTDKQIKTLLFINNRLGTDYEPLLKVQCWRIINKNLQDAIAYKQVHERCCAEDFRDWYGSEWDYF